MCIRDSCEVNVSAGQRRLHDVHRFFPGVQKVSNSRSAVGLARGTVSMECCLAGNGREMEETGGSGSGTDICAAETLAFKLLCTGFCDGY